MTAFKAMLRAIMAVGQVYEVRIPKSRLGTISGYFDNVDALVKAVEQWDGKVPGIYFTMNSANPALLARAKNRLQTHAKTTTSDEDIIRRTFLLIDCDVKRPAEISSSEPEHQEALARCISIEAWLTEHGWPGPVRADSGNGGHLLYRIDLPNDAASTALVKGCLEVLAFKFNDHIVVDTSVSNAARITKVYGTMACKGDSTEDRPHRRSSILSIPDELIPVPQALLSALAAQRPVDPKPTSRQTNGTRFDLHDFMRRHQLDVTGEKPWNGATVYELEHCPFNPEHGRGESSLIQFPSGALQFKCFHNSCQPYHWQELRTRLEPDRSRSSHPPPSGRPAPADPHETEFTLVAANSVTMATPKWLSQGRVPLAMLALLAGRGGLGKSTLVIHWAAGVTTGDLAGELAGNPAHVIISSTEDVESVTLVPRLTAAKADLSKVHFIHLHRRGIDGSLTIPEDIDILRQAIEQTGARFIIIDPLMSHLSASVNSWNDQELRRALDPLARLAAEKDVAILVIAHLNKDAKKEAIDRIGGSAGISNGPRSVLFAGPDPDDPDGAIKMLAHPKCNVGPQQPTLRYRIETVRLPNAGNPIETTRIVWEGEAHGITADDLVAKPDPLSRDERDQAVHWLEQALPVGSRKKQIDLEAAAAKDHIAIWKLRKAKTLLNVQSKKTGFAPAIWWWTRDPDLYISPDLSPSDKHPSNPLKNAKMTEDNRPLIFDAPSTPEDDRKSSSVTFESSSYISTGYITPSLEDNCGGLYREACVDP